MAQPNEEQPSAGYPIGRGYGHDYMRGGEVFGGYGYSQRGAYEATRGEHPDPNEPAADGVLLDAAALDLSHMAPPDSAIVDEQLSHIEHTFGSNGGNVRHSRSYYVTQAQLQQRLRKNGDVADGPGGLGADHLRPPGHEVS